MQRFYLPAIPGEAAEIADQTIVHQISRVLRYEPGDRAVLFSDGGGGEYEIAEMGKKSVSFFRIRTIEPSNDPEIRVVLYQALPNRTEKIETLLQKGTEVGVAEFVLFPSERSQKLVLSENRIERFRAIMREAVEQCGGFRMPVLRFEMTFPAIPEDVPAAFLHTDFQNAATGIRDFVKSLSESDESVGILVGPEGGFTDAELSKALSMGATAVRAGERILRTETTGPVAAFAIVNGMAG